MEVAVQRKQRWRRRAATLLALVMTTAGVVVGAGAPAQAVPGLFEVPASSETNSNADRVARADCPEGTKVYGAQGSVITGNGSVAIDGVVPSENLQTVRVYAHEIRPYDQLWRVMAFAVCGPPVANLQRSGPFRSAASDSTSTKSAAATCPTGLALYGMGADLTGGFGSVVQTAMAPLTTTVGFVRTQELFNAYPGNWSAIAYGICGAPSANMQIRSAVTASSVSSSRSITTSCPAGTKSHQVGGLIQPSGANNVVLNTMTDIAGTLDVPRAEAWQVRDSTGGPWSLSVFALCSS
jgi:hypothetical protein